MNKDGCQSLDPARLDKSPPFYILWAWALIFLALHWFPTVFDARWGFDAFSALPLCIRIVCTVIVLCLISPHIAQRALRVLGLFLGRAAKHKRVFFACVLAILCVCLWGLRSQVLSLNSDGMDWVSMAEEGECFHFKEAGATLLFYLAYRLAQPISPYALDTIAAVVSLCGAVFFAFLMEFAAEAKDSALDGALLFCLATGTGMIQIFFGHPETYGPLVAAMMVYLYFGLRCIKGKSGLVAVGLAFGVAVAIHLSAVLLGPSLLLLAAQKPGRRGKNFALACGAAALPVAALLSVIAYWGYDGPIVGFRELGGGDNILFVALWGKPQNEIHMRLLGTRHIAFLANEVLFIMPAVIPTLAIVVLCGQGGRAASQRPRRFLAVAAAPWVGFLLFFNPDLGMLDWDLFAACALPATLWAGVSLLAARDRRAALFGRYVVLVLASLGIVHTVPVLVHNASLPPASKYFAVGRFYWIDNKFRKAERYFQRGLQINPKSWQAHEALGDTYWAMGKAENARTEWEASLRMNPHNDAVKPKLAKLRERGQ